jgi:hypothetical protein
MLIAVIQERFPQGRELDITEGKRRQAVRLMGDQEIGALVVLYRTNQTVSRHHFVQETDSRA